MFRRYLLACLVLCAVSAPTSAQHPIAFEVKLLTVDANEGCDLADVDGDGKLDVVAGRNWYHNSDWVGRPIRLIEDRNGYARSNGEWAHDVNDDGRPDVISVDFFEGTVRWFENPGADGLTLGNLWKPHELVVSGYNTNEASFLVDLNGDQAPEWISDQWNKENPAVIFSFDQKSDPSKKEESIILKPNVIGPTTGHGMGFGDLNQDGNTDILVGLGWYEHPKAGMEGEWIFHPDWEQHAACPMLVRDINGDGIQDIITSNAHDFGVYLWKGTEERGKDGKLQFEKQLIDNTFSQAHCLHMVDLDGDGTEELVTGKRVRAHNGNDPGGKEPPVVKYFVWNQDKQAFEGHTINRGEVGIGLQIRSGDIDGDGDIDLLMAGKDGTQILFSQLKN